MKRKQFLHRLLQISELNQYLNPLKDIPLIFSKPFKIEQRVDNRESHLYNRTKQQFHSQNHDNEEFRHGEVLIINQNRTAKNLITKINANKKNNSKRRLKSMPANSNITNDRNQEFSMERTEQMAQQSSDRKFSFASVDMKQKLSPKTQHFMSISEIRPQISPTKKIAHRQLIYSKQGRQNIRHKQLEEKDSMPRKHSMMESSCEQNQNCIKTTRPTFQKMAAKKIREASNNIQSNIQANKTNESINQIITIANDKRNQQRKAKISMRKQINRNYTKPFMPPPKLTARSYIVYQIKEIPEESKVIVSFNSKLSQEVASLTKIMTCILTIEICRDLDLDKYATEVTIGKMETSIGGTTADLEEGQIYTIQQLLYGLMLPSGNDASVALAVWGGGRLLQNQRQIELKLNFQKQKKRQTEQWSKNQTSTSCLSTNSPPDYRKPTKSECYARFIQSMNSKAKYLNLSKTSYANSHGLMNPSNKSSAFDIALLCEYAMKNQTFRNIVHCRNFKGTIKVSHEGKKAKMYETKSENHLEGTGQSEDYQNLQVKHQHHFKQPPLSAKTSSIEWQNTHKLLHLRPKEYLGIKTGFTTAAGPCLASCVSVEERQFIIVVLGCERMSFRFHETQILKKWLYKHENIAKSKLKQSTTSPDEPLCEQGVGQANLSNILKQLAIQQQIQD